MQTVSYGFFIILWICFSAVTKAQNDCPGSSIPKNLNTELPRNIKEIYAERETVRLTCQAGYAGFVRIICTNGDWTITGRNKCELKQCGHPGDTPHGDFMLTEGDDFVFGSQVEYFCKKGYRLAGKVNRRSCMDQGWDNAVPICEVVRCEPIQQMEYMHTSGNTENPQYGDIIQFECLNDDKKIDGEKQIYCTDTGKWSTNLPTCVDVTCKPPVIPNGWVTNPKTIYRRDDILSFACGERHTPVGRPHSTCTEHDWRPKPQCEEKVCKVRTLANISPQKSVFYPGEHATISCNPPYRTRTKKQRDIAECGYDGWSFDIECEEITCFISPDDHADAYYGGYSVHHRNRPPYYRCHAGFKKSSDSICEVQGWVPPLCQEIICDSKIPNANILSEIKKYKLNENLQYECKPFYEPEGLQQAKCTENGWRDQSGRAPDCRAKTGICKRPVIDDGYHIDDINDPLVIYYGCLPGYKPLEGGWWGKSTCTQNKWSDIPKCIDETKCVPPTILNATPRKKEDLYSEGESLIFQCDAGYEMESNDVIKCVNGHWESPLPICKPLATMCNPPPRVEYATITSKYKEKYTHLSRVQFQCTKLYEIEGNREVTCIYGNWTLIPKCIRSKCLSPEDKVKNVVLVRKKEEPYENGSKVDYKCKDATFIPEGETTAICINGIWQYPVCKRKENCEKPVIEHGYVLKEKFNEGDILEYKCYDNCRPKTNSNITCIHGQWNQLVECTCQHQTTKSCPEPPIPENGDIREKRTEGGETVITYKCKLKYSLKDNAKVKCRMGEWKPYPVCLPPCVIEIIDPRYNIQDPKRKIYVEQGKSAILRCKSSFYNIPWIQEIQVKCEEGKIDYENLCKHQSTFY